MGEEDTVILTPDEKERILKDTPTEDLEEENEEPDQALFLMKIIDAIYESAATGAPVAC